MEERIVKGERHGRGVQDPGYLVLRLRIHSSKSQEEVRSLKRALQRERERERKKIGLGTQHEEPTKMKRIRLGGRPGRSRVERKAGGWRPRVSGSPGSGDTKH